jgi:hypothetical protein
MGLGRRKPKRTLTGLSIDTTDIACFFSLRRLPSYTGNCIRVVRDSDSTSLDIGFLGDLLDVAAISSFCSGTIGRVDRIYEQVSNGSIIWAKTTSANRPIIYTGGTVVSDAGKPALLFDNNDELVGSSAIQCRSIFTVYKVTTLQNAVNTILQASGVGFFTGGTGSLSGTPYTGTGIFSSSIIRVQNTSEGTNKRVSTWILDTNDIYVWTNGTDPATGSFTISTPGILTIGRQSNAQSINGFWQETIGYTTTKFANRASIEDEQKIYYGI